MLRLVPYFVGVLAMAVVAVAWLHWVNMIFFAEVADHCGFNAPGTMTWLGCYPGIGLDGGAVIVLVGLGLLAGLLIDVLVTRDPRRLLVLLVVTAVVIAGFGELVHCANRGGWRCSWVQWLEEGLLAESPPLVRIRPHPPELILGGPQRDAQRPSVPTVGRLESYSVLASDL